MSPVEWLHSTVWWSFPRVSGDEPATERAYLREEEFSPRERG